MSWKSTKDVTINYALSKIYDKLEDATNEEIAEILEILTNKEGFNYRIIEDKKDD